MPKLTPRLIADAGRAAIELAAARFRVGVQQVNDLLPSAGEWRKSDAAVSLDARAAALAERVAFVVPRVASRVPWRADCLVQALAAERWLKASGVPSRLFVGVRKHGALAMEAHAWLIAGDRMVTGGDFDGYSALTCVSQ